MSRGKRKQQRRRQMKLTSAAKGIRKWQKELLPQNDEYSCGPIAIGHLIKALDVSNSMKKKVEGKDVRAGKYLRSMGIEAMMRRWVTECADQKELDEQYAEQWQEGRKGEVGEVAGRKEEEEEEGTGLV